MTACSGGAQFGAVDLGELVVEGEVDPDYLYLQLRQLDPTFEACYVRALRQDRIAEGVIDLGNTSAHPNDPTEKDDFADELARLCRFLEHLPDE